jgi:hypothetical protein
LEEANCCGFGLQQNYNNIYAAFFEAVAFRNMIRVDILLMLNFLSNIRIELRSVRKKRNDASLLMTG